MARAGAAGPGTTGATQPPSRDCSATISLLYRVLRDDPDHETARKAAGWVRRGEDPADARRTLVFETGQGRATVAALLAQAKAHETSLLQDFSERDVTALKKILRSLISRGDGNRPAGSDLLDSVK